MFILLNNSLSRYPVQNYESNYPIIHILKLSKIIEAPDPRRSAKQNKTKQTEKEKQRDQTF